VFGTFDVLPTLAPKNAPKNALAAAGRRRSNMEALRRRIPTKVLLRWRHRTMSPASLTSLVKVKASRIIYWDGEDEGEVKV
jgi:hypothetical protein